MIAKKKVLLIDDSDEIRSLYQIAFEDSEIFVETASSRDQAISILTAGAQFDLIIVDFRMAGMSLDDFIQFCGSLPQLTASKIIVVSSYSERDPEVMKLTVPFFQKPAGLDELLRLVRSALGLQA